MMCEQRISLCIIDCMSRPSTETKSSGSRGPPMGARPRCRIGVGPMPRSRTLRPGIEYNGLSQSILIVVIIPITTDVYVGRIVLCW